MILHELVPFTLAQTIPLALGTGFWIAFYFILVRNAMRTKFVEMPVFAACGNIAWEFLWGYVFTTAGGLIISWSYKAAFLLDIVIFYHVVRYGARFATNALVARYWRELTVLGMLAWGATLYFMAAQVPMGMTSDPSIKEIPGAAFGLDTNMGSNSAYILTFAISALYVLQFINMQDISKLSYAIVWCKLFGNIGYTVFLFMLTPDNLFLLTLGVVAFVFDLVYAYIFAQRRRTLLV